MSIIQKIYFILLYKAFISSKFKNSVSVAFGFNVICYLWSASQSKHFYVHSVIRLCRNMILDCLPLDYQEATSNGVQLHVAETKCQQASLLCSLNNILQPQKIYLFVFHLCNRALSSYPSMEWGRVGTTPSSRFCQEINTISSLHLGRFLAGHAQAQSALRL